MIITPEGRLKIIWTYLQLKNKHIKYYQHFEEGGQRQEM
jgi:hypothetical protein